MFSNTYSQVIPDFQVNENVYGSDQLYSFISVDSNGNFVITWADNRNDGFDIYAQLYSSDGTALGSNFKVNDSTGSGWMGRPPFAMPSISTDSRGNFVITWPFDLDIYAQRYSSDGTALGSEFKVNDDEGSAFQDRPSISIDSSGNFVITWTDERNDNFDIYA
jgi:hypothetical protein